METRFYVIPTSGEPFGFAYKWRTDHSDADLIPWMLQSRNLAETSASLTDRVRSYLDSNCSQCHQPGGVRTFFDARLTTPLENQGLIHGELETNYGDDLNRVIRPGDPARSIMLLRMGDLASIKMPPIAKHIVDQPAIQLFTDWINSLGTGPLVALTGSATTTDSFQVNVHFSDSVTGLNTGDFEILHGSATGITNGGTEYILTVTPGGYTTTSVSLSAGRAQNLASAGNYASNVYVQTISEPPATDPDGLLSWYRFTKPQEP